METVFLLFKKIVVLLFLGSLSFLSHAQKDESPQHFETLFGDNISHGGYGALSMGYTKLGNYDAFAPGIRGAWIIGHGIGIGFEGTGFITELTTGILPDEDYSFITGGYGGLMIEPIFFGLRPIHFTVPIVIGAGAVVFESSSNYTPSYPNSYYHTDYDQFFMVESGIEIEMNVTRFFRLALGAKYRFTTDVDLTTTNDADQTLQVLSKNDLDNYTINLSFKFGKF